jgi:lipopolysaccharide export LptBFGC system permease protein LptF
MAFTLQETSTSGRDDNINNSNNDSKRLSNNGTNDETMTDSSSRDSDASSQGSMDRKATKEVRKSDVSELVAKSKKAASSLWTLLHAKVSLSLSVIVLVLKTGT